MENQTTFCIECRTETKYKMQYVTCTKTIREKEYEFTILEARCAQCGAPVTVPGLMDINAQEIDLQYREAEDIVTIKEISDLMEVYKLGKAPLSLALGFGEITVTRYLAGQIPSKEYSDVIRQALKSPRFMMEKLEENKDKIGEAAYKKAMRAAKELEPLYSLSEKMLLSISYIFYLAEEITPLALQKMLYYIQGVYMQLFQKELFSEDCVAWVHGPVYKDVYEVFRNFKYNPIEDNRFSLLQNRFRELSQKEKIVIELVVDSFGMYSGKALEKITHTETPWQEARTYCLPQGRSNVVISKESIRNYFAGVAEQFQINSVAGLRDYIDSRLGDV
ncbi:MAG: DUF4065 domain-containing protein [Lachnospiraceae bacterium]|nr:DUF4065 domain-containing protein [Lachnospiraceae bacterium]